MDKDSDGKLSADELCGMPHGGGMPPLAATRHRRSRRDGGGVVRRSLRARLLQEHRLRIQFLLQDIDCVIGCYVISMKDAAQNNVSTIGFSQSTMLVRMSFLRMPLRRQVSQAYPNSD